MNTTQLTDADLLEIYAPVLRFSGGEKFHPMNVEDFIMGSPYLLRKKGKKEEGVAGWQEAGELEARLVLLGKKHHGETYMQFVPRRSINWKLVLIVLFLVMVIVMGVSLLGTALLPGILEGKIDPGILQSMKVGWTDTGKIILLAFLICIWPLIDADGKVHLAFLLNLFTIFFFGTVFTTALLILMAGLVVGLMAVHFVFYKGSIKMNGTEIRFIPQENISQLNFWGLLCVLGGSGLVGFLLGLALHRPIETAAISGFSAFLFCVLLLRGNRAEGTKLREANAVQLLFAMSLLVMSLPLLAYLCRIFDLSFSIMFAVSLSGVSLLWYALDPFSPIKPGLLLEENERKLTLAWDFRILFIVAIVLGVNAVVNWAIFATNTQQIDKIITASILHFLFSAGNLLFTLVILGTRVGSYFLDLFSSLNRMDVASAKQSYESLRNQRKGRTDIAQNKPYWYYGRVCRDGKWIVLQYNYFYAFNDFRTSAGGMNDHEGDWENVTVYVHQEGELHRDCDERPHRVPFGVAYSQHYNGEFRFWEDVKRVTEIGGRETCHPLVYVALGSHANYPEPEVYDPSTQFSGIMHRFVSLLEWAIRLLRPGATSDVEKYNRGVNRTVAENSNTDQEEKEDGKIAQGGLSDLGSREFAAGDGMRIGYSSPATDYGAENKVALHLPEHIKSRESNFDGGPAKPEIEFVDWAFEVITDTRPDWVQYKGMWGRWTNVEGENGPQGPKWDSSGGIRLRWGKSDDPSDDKKGLNVRRPLEWMDVLLMDIFHNEGRPADLRKKALRQITSD